jgi:hypothetical protein
MKVSSENKINDDFDAEMRLFEAEIGTIKESESTENTTEIETKNYDLIKDERGEEESLRDSLKFQKTVEKLKAKRARIISLGQKKLTKKSSKLARRVQQVVRPFEDEDLN